MSEKFIIYIILIILNIITGIILQKKRDKISFLLFNHKLRVFTPANILTFVLMGYLIYLTVITVNIPDYAGYEHDYYSSITKYEMGYETVRYAFQYMGVSFSAFRGVVAFVCFSLMFVSLRKMKINTNIAFGIYSIIPFTYDAIQTRNFLCSAIVIFGMQYLIGEKKKSIHKFIIAIIIACFFHKVAILYLILALADQSILECKWKKRLLGGCFIFTVLVAFLTKYFSEVRVILLFYFSTIDSTKALAYLNINEMRWGFLYYWMIQILFIFSSFVLKRGMNSLNNGDKRLAEKVFWINISLGCIFPLYLIGTDFSRLFRNLLIFNYCLLGITGSKTRISIISKICAIAGICFSFYMYVYNFGIDIDQTFWTFFK